MSGARQVAVRGIGYSALILALHGFGPADVESPRQQPGGGGTGATQRAPTQRQIILPQIVAPQQAETEQRAADEQAATKASQAQAAATEPATRQGVPHTKPAGAPIAPQATSVPATPENAATARIQAATDRISAPAIDADQTTADEPAADRTKDRQRRIAIALALLMLNDA